MGCLPSVLWLKDGPVSAYDRVLYDSLRTGDILLFHGEAVTSFEIEMACESPWSHIGMILELDGGRKYLLESSRTPCHLRDALTNTTNKTGCRLVPLDARIRSYGSTLFAVRHICYHSDNQYAAAKRDLLALARELSCVTYNADAYNMFFAVYDGLGGEMHGTSHASMFCSELIAYVSQRMGWLLWSPSHKEYIPGDFQDYKGLPTTGNVSWSAPILFHS